VAYDIPRQGRSTPSRVIAFSGQGGSGHRGHRTSSDSDIHAARYFAPLATGAVKDVDREGRGTRERTERSMRATVKGGLRPSRLLSSMRLGSQPLFTCGRGRRLLFGRPKSFF
jgi:hypothetical protein